MTKTVLLTGSQGFTGRYVRTALEAAGYRVIGLVQAHPGQNEFQADLLDLAALRSVVAQVRPEYVIHLAALAFIGHDSAEAYYRVNVFGTLNLLEALHAEQIDLHKIILASSANIYGNPPVSKVPETTPPAPINHYAMSKLAMEYMAKTWLDKLPIVFTRPFNYTGYGQDKMFLIPKIVDYVKQGAREIPLGNLDVEREYNDVRMVAQMYVGLLQKAEIGSTYNLCTGIAHQVLDVIKCCVDLTGRPIEPIVDSQFVRQNELKVLVGDPTRINALLPDLPIYSLKDTLAWMLDLS